MINTFVLKNIKTIEMTGVLMRISSFSLVSWLGPHSPFLFVWIFKCRICSCVYLFLFMQWSFFPHCYGLYRVLSAVL
jgi:hypothetical protein